jgi:Mg/Co/Ni transporter MgtE
MTTHSLLLDQEETVATALRQVRHALLEGHNLVEAAYVTTPSVQEGPPVVVGAVSLGELLAADPADQMRDLVHMPLIGVRTDTDLSTVAECMIRTRLLALPVLDAGSRFQGVVHLADIMGRLLGTPPRHLRHLAE